ncbi:MAG: hypothetical protein FWF68_09260 [Spirochaetes bacterium]|nr:hypothetical protein [Spirochaetota bacterium]
MYKYNGQYPNNPARGDWTLSTPGGNIRQLAATNSEMYALCGESENFILKKSSDGSNWSNVTSTGIIVQAIYSANNSLFVGTGTSGAHSIYYYNGSSFTNLADTSDKLLNGAAHDGSTYYLSVKSLITESGGGIYTASTLTQLSAQLIGNSADIPFMGIINLGTNSIAAISRREGVLYTVTSSGVTNTNHKLGNDKLATGALLVWNSNLLLAGRQDEMKNSINYLHGYRELELSSGSIIGADFRDPGTHSPSTVDNNATYRSTLEKNPVKHLFQADDGTLFASTYTNGVWSYRLRNNRWQWNSEQ